MIDTALFFLSFSRPKNRSEVIEILSKNRDFVDFLTTIQSGEVKIMVSNHDKRSKKDMYEYYHKVVLSVTMKFMEDQGWLPVTKVKADELLKEQFCQSLHFNEFTNKEQVIYLEKKDMTYQRLHKYITDCINWLEIENGYRVPEAQKFKANI